MKQAEKIYVQLKKGLAKSMEAKIPIPLSRRAATNSMTSF
jgi:hypothetical protein